MKLQNFFPRLYLVLIACVCLGLTPSISYAQYSGIAVLTNIINKCDVVQIEDECTGIILDEEDCDYFQYIGDPCEEGQVGTLISTEIGICTAPGGGAGDQCIAKYLCCDAP